MLEHALTLTEPRLQLSTLAMEVVQNTQLVQRLQLLALRNPQLTPPIAVLIGTFTDDPETKTLKLSQVNTYTSFSEIVHLQNIPHLTESLDIKTAYRPNDAHRGLLGFITVGGLEGLVHEEAVPITQANRFCRPSPRQANYNEAVSRGQFGWAPHLGSLEIIDKRLKAIWNSLINHEKLGINILLDPFILFLNGKTKILPTIDGSDEFDITKEPTSIRAIPLSAYGQDDLIHLPIDERIAYEGTNALYLRFPFGLFENGFAMRSIFRDFQVTDPRQLIKFTGHHEQSRNDILANLAQLYLRDIYTALIGINSSRSEQSVIANFDYRGTNSRVNLERVAIGYWDQSDEDYINQIRDGFVPASNSEVPPIYENFEVRSRNEE